MPDTGLRHSSIESKDMTKRSVILWRYLTVRNDVMVTFDGPQIIITTSGVHNTRPVGRMRRTVAHSAARDEFENNNC